MNKEQAFEQAIQSGKGDVLQVWVEYIKWWQETKIKLEQDPIKKSENQRKLAVLHERCITTPALQQEKYKNDLRLIRAWVSYASAQPDPTITFAKLYNKKFGIDTALFYVAWATALESLSTIESYKEAYRVLELGQQRKEMIQSQFQGLGLSKQTFEDFVRNFRQRFNIMYYGKEYNGKKEVPGYDKSATNPPLNEADEFCFEEVRAKLPRYRYTQELEEMDDVDMSLTNVGGSIQTVESTTTNIQPHMNSRQSLSRARKRMSIFQDAAEGALLDEATLKQPSHQAAPQPQAQPRRSILRQSLAAPPTPTIHTRIATNILDQMFSGPLLEEENEFEIKKKMRKVNKEQPAPAPVSAPSKASQFAIFEDEQEESAPAPAFKAPAPSKIPIFEDKENLPSSTPQKPKVVDAAVVKQQYAALAAQMKNTVTFQSPVDPCSNEVMSLLAGQVTKFLAQDPTFFDCSEQIPPHTKNLKGIVEKQHSHPLQLGEQTFLVDGYLGTGAYANVYSVQLDTTKTSINISLDSDILALKIQTPACPWEYYIARKIQSTIPADMRYKFVAPVEMYSYKKESFMLMQYGGVGTLLDSINIYKEKKKTFDEVLIMYYTLEIIRVLEVLHQQCGVIHCDIKPDNFLILNNDTGDGEWDGWTPEGGKGWDKKGLTLIDFGKAIDVSLFPNDTFFKEGALTENFGKEVLAGKQWKNNVDCLGLCGVIYCMIFQDYMKVKTVEANGAKRVALATQLKRYWKIEVWSKVFDVLLNCKPTEAAEALSEAKNTIVEYLQKSNKAKSIKAIVCRHYCLMFDDKQM